MDKCMTKGMNHFVFIVALIAGISGFLFGFDSSLIADLKDQIIDQLALTDWQWSIVVSISLLGCVIGIPLSGLVADRISRRSFLKMVALGFILGTSICALSHDYIILLIGRFIIGVCIGIASYIAPLFISEISPPKRRGTLVLINGLTITFGQAIAYLLGYFIHDISSESWRIMFWLGCFPATMLYIGMSFIPHSPRWILKKQGKEAALEALKRIRPAGSQVEEELDEIQSVQHQQKGAYLLLLKRPVVFVLLLGILLGIFQQFSGINVIMYYGPVIFESAGFTPVTNAILATFWMGVVNFLFTLVTFIYIDKLGRRALLLYGTLLAAVSLYSVSLLFNYSFPGQKYLILLAFTTYIMGFCISVGSLFWVVIAEIYPARVRGLAMSIATVMQWAANFLVSISFLGIYQTFGQSMTFSLYASMCLLAFVVVYYFVPETTGISLEQIEKNLLSGKKLREIGKSSTSRGMSSGSRNLDDKPRDVGRTVPLSD